MSQLGYTQLFTNQVAGSSAFHRNITINHNLCGSSDSLNFPVLVSASDSTLKTVANGGHVANINGYDILFYSDAGFTTLMSWEIDFYDPVNGILVVHLLVPTVSHTVDTTFYMKYGDGTITTFQGGATGAAWNSKYNAVYHFPNGTTLTTNDSTSHAQNLSATGSPAPNAGQIDGCMATFSGSAVNATASLPINTAARTLSIWFKLNSNTTGAIMGYGTANTAAFAIEYAGFLQLLCFSGCAMRCAFTYDTNWHLLHCVYPVGDDLTNTYFYVDGVKQTQSFLATGVINTTSNNINVGNDARALGVFPGYLDEARFLNAALTQNWITTEYNNQKNPGNIGSANFLTYGSEY